jgi:citrate lyase subunit beta/citryl-CoA lyase
MPASNAKAVAKARTLPCDVVILDLEDAVAPDAKDQARQAAVNAVREGGFGHREVIVRVNAPDTPYWADDCAAVRSTGVPVLIPKVGSRAMLQACAVNLPGRALWAMIETCEGILNIAEIAASRAELPLEAFIIGTNDLAKEMFCRLEASRKPVWAALTMTVIAARRHGISVFDGVFNDISDTAGLEAECREGADFGFDGKSLIHPSQIDPCNGIFSPTDEELRWAHTIIDVFASPENAALNALKIEGRMVERLHTEAAKRTIRRAG